MPHQIALTVVTQVQPGKTQALKDLLGSIRENRDHSLRVPFDQLEATHFARFMVLDEVKDRHGKMIPASLAFLSNCDAPLAPYLDALVTTGGEGLDSIYSHCEGYPAFDQRTAASRLAYLKRHMAPTPAFYINTIGRSVQQIRQEDRLRAAIEVFLDSRDWSGWKPADVRQAIQEFVESQPELNWAKFPPAPPALTWRLRETLHKIGVPLFLLLLLPLLAIVIPIGLVLIRFQEERDIPDRSEAAPERIRELRADEDFGIQNQIVAIGFFKPGLLRQITAQAVLSISNYATRHIYTQGQLSGLNTIHLARWVKVDGGRRLFFTSNYDGSLESYMNDFIDKAAWGLNAIFSNGEGFPKTRWLFFDGIRDELAYKRFLPTRQIPTQVWYSAYPHLSTVNLQNNSAIRAGLFGSMNREQIEAWLRRL